MTIEKKLLGTNPVSGEVLPEAVSFDGTNDNLYRSSDLAGNADGKTFTLSFWVYHDPNAVQGIYRGYKAQNNLDIRFSASDIIIEGKYSNSLNLSMYSSGALVPRDTFVNIIISIDMSNTSRRFVYMNDVDVTSRFTFATYNNALLSFTYTNHYIASRSPSASRLHGRLANFFMDRTYRDLSVTANRRLFITADGKPSDTIPSNPIIYLPMKDAATAGSNSGTGGDFSVTGLLATAERGPNQDNCVASTFDGSADYLSKTNGNSLSNSKTITCAFTFMPLAGNSTSDIIIFDDYNVGGGGAQGFVQLLSGNSIRASFELTGTGLAGRVQTQAILTFGVHYAVAISFDTANSSKSKIYVNGVSQTLATNTMNNIVCEIDMNYVNIGRYRRNASNFVKGSLGELYFHNTYTDLATENPFWDSDTNRPNSLRKVIEDTGVTPAIAMPLLGNDAGNNLGSGGDFTVNSGPFTGARGGSEFWARSAETTGTNGDYLGRTGLTGGASSANITVAFAVYLDTNNTQKQWWHMIDNELYAMNENSGQVYIGNAYGSSDVYIGTAGNPFSTGSWHTVLFSMISNGTSTQRHVYVDGVIPASVTWNQTRSAFDLSLSNTCAIQSDAGGTQVIDGKVAGLYIEQVYTDFSQEVNRNKFINQLGYMVEQIDGSPLVYMKFDPASLGTNSGSGGNFTVNGTVTAGSDVTP